jgi:hypothetical protein
MEYERVSLQSVRLVVAWQPPRDSNPDTLLQRQMSYH